MYEFSTYEMAWRFMIRVDELAIRPYNHHPRWQNTFNRIEFWLCTFNIGHKPSKRDLRLARILEWFHEQVAKIVHCGEPFYFCRCLESKTLPHSVGAACHN
jgi:pterin-4a-carbinolamine dehydratase